MRRVMVIGCPGAGKTTLARMLAERLSLPLVHLDNHYWRPGWQMPGDNEWRRQVVALVAASNWIMDGHYAGTFDIRMSRADTLIWLDFPRATCLRRVLWRILSGYGRVRFELPAGCPERFDAAFLRYVWGFRAKERPRIVQAIERFGDHLRIYQLTDDHDVDRFLAAVGAS
jgi:adenylate kinase family enzyme